MFWIFRRLVQVCPFNWCHICFPPIQLEQCPTGKWGKSFGPCHRQSSSGCRERALEKEIRLHEGLTWCFPDIIWAPLPTGLYQKFKYIHFLSASKTQAFGIMEITVKPHTRRQANRSVFDCILKSNTFSQQIWNEWWACCSSEKQTLPSTTYTNFMAKLWIQGTNIGRALAWSHTKLPRQSCVLNSCRGSVGRWDN